MAPSFRPVRPKCFFLAITLAWAVAIFLSSALVALAGLSPLAAGKGLPQATWVVADEVGPAAKLAFVLILAPLLFASVTRLRGAAALAAEIASGCAAMLLTLLLLPESWSRGFGIGLSATRLDPALAAIYLASAAVAAVAFHFSLAKCRRTLVP
ncbi:MAG: hypothetical protein ACJ8EB_11410 [Allosphingosinicella sp.]